MSIEITEHELSYDHTYRSFAVTLSDDCILTMVTKMGSDVEDWISEITRIHHRRLHKLIVGLDVEWRPNFGRDRVNPVAVLQLCVGRRCLVFQIMHADYIPDALVEFLQNTDFRFVGIGIGADARKLEEDYNIEVSNQIDLAVLAANEIGGHLRHAGVKTLADEVLDIQITKPKRVTLSRWDYYHLRLDQIQYACVDAFISFEIGRVLLS